MFLLRWKIFICVPLWISLLFPDFTSHFGVSPLLGFIFHLRFSASDSGFHLLLPDFTSHFRFSLPLSGFYFPFPLLTFHLRFSPLIPGFCFSLAAFPSTSNSNFLFPVHLRLLLPILTTLYLVFTPFSLFLLSTFDYQLFFSGHF